MNNSMSAQNKDGPPVKILDITNIQGPKNILS